jgi:uncharacterized protein (TIGR04222 family)
MVDELLEWVVVSYFKTPRTVQEFLSDRDTMNVGKKFCRKLADEGLLSDISIYLWRLIPALATLTLLIWGLVNIGTSAEMQKEPRLFMGAVFFTMFGVFFLRCINTWFKERTGAGEKVLQRARLRFNHLKENTEKFRPGGETNNATILAATFGIDALPSDHFGYVLTLFPKPSDDSG